MTEFEFGPILEEEKINKLCLACYLDEYSSKFGSKIIYYIPALFLPLWVYLPLLWIVYYATLISFDRHYRV